MFELMMVRHLLQVNKLQKVLLILVGGVYSEQVDSLATRYVEEEQSRMNRSAA